MLGFKRKTRRYRRRRLTPIEDDRWSLTQDTRRTIIIILLFTLAVLGLISLFNGAGNLGQWLKWALGQIFGWADWLALLLLLILDYFLIFSDRYNFKKINYVGLLLLILSVVGLLDLWVRDLTLEQIREAQSGGGLVGYLVGHNLVKFAGLAGSLVIFSGLLLSGLFIFFNTSFRQLRERWLDWRGLWSRDSVPADALEQPPLVEADGLPDDSGEELEEEETEVGAETAEEGEESVKKEPGKHTYKRLKHVPIPIELLTAASGKPTSGDIKANAFKIEKAFENFGIQVTMGDVSVGPTVTQYTLKPAEGVKLAQITTLQNDIALALAAHPIRIEAPIPGKSLVGIEVPNQVVSIVRLRDILSSEIFKHRATNLMVALGKDVSGKPVMADLGRMPHLLIAGATGSGKSVAINSIIISLLWQNSPSDLKFVMIDPKRVELSAYNDLPHLLTPVITDVKATIHALRWIVGEMDERYKLLAAAGKKNIDSYNSALLLNRLPYIVVIIDELADLMAVAVRDVEAAIIRLAQMARAVGIHLVLATQRPSVNVITGLIKANITSRAAFAVASQTDSRTIIDMSGAEKLLGNGDMLYTSAELSKPRRLQGAYVSEQEVTAVTDYLRQQGQPEYNLAVTEANNQRSSSNYGQIDSDEEDLTIATDVIVKAGRASATLLQSRMRIGFAKAARLLDLLEDRGIVGPAQGAKPREVLVSEEDMARRYREDQPLETADELLESETEAETAEAPDETVPEESSKNSADDWLEPKV